MKIRTMKLREAHKSGENGEKSLCSILWDSTGDHVVTASSVGNSICIHDPTFPSNAQKVLRHHREGVTALAISPNSTCLASGSIDHSVKLYKFPGGDFETNITRFTLPIRAVAFNKSGTILAAAGDDEGIKLVNTIDGTIARVLKGHKRSVTSLAFDPKSDYLASLDSVGTVIIWELQSGCKLHELKAIAPDNGSDVSVLNILAWSPDGEMLAVPGTKNDVVMYDRDTAEKLFSLRGDHLEPICFLSWSPNGKYMATSGLDRQIFIWDVDKKQDIERQKFSECISCMAWKPLGNALAVIDVMGKYGVWESVVPLTMKSPTQGIPCLSSRTSNGLVLFNEEQGPSASGNTSESNQDTLGEFELPSRKRLRKESVYDDDCEDDQNDEQDSFVKVESHKKTRDKFSRNGKSESKSMPAVAVPKMQEAFQPGSTPTQPGKRHFLCYNMLGSITVMEHEGYSHIEIDFHDTSSGPRVPAMTDYFGFTMASLDENGSAFANPSKGKKHMSTLLYRPFGSWANNTEWSMRFEEEEVRAISVGSAWVAALTSLNFLRIFTEGGLQRYILSLDGPVVTAAGYKDQLAIVTHISPCLPTNEQMLEFRVLDIPHGTEISKGRLPLTPGSCLAWFGFSEEGQLSSFDSKGVLRVFTSQYGGCWLPLFSASKLNKPDEKYWVVGLNSSKLFCVVCKSPESFPQVSSPRPVLSLLDLSFPLAASDLGAESLENAFMMNNMHLSQIQRKIEERAASGHDTTSLDEEAFNLETSLDSGILRLIASCCNGDKQVRATELVKFLSLEKSIRGAIKLVTVLKLPNLAERFNDILEEKLLSENPVNSVLPGGKFSYNGSIKQVNAVPSKSYTSPEFSKTPESVAASPVQTLSSLSSTRKQDDELCNEDEIGKSEKHHHVASLKSITMKASLTSNARNANSTSTKQGNAKKINPQISTRPSNPFAKLSSNQESHSLFDSLKKPKKS